MAKLTKILFLMIFLSGAAHSVRGATLVSHNNLHSQGRLSIHVSDGGWGEGRIQDIEKVLYSAAGEIFAYVPTKRDLAIIVRHTEDHPVALYQRGPNGEFIVLLSAEGHRWSQYAYQFSHEFFHVLAMNSKATKNQNQWFEESLGETASLFALRRMAITWRSSPPYPNWRDYASSLHSYAQNNLNGRHRNLPSGMTLAEWFEENEELLRQDPYQREKNAVVANQLLSLFEANPDGWAAVTYLNLSKASREQTFEEYLNDWHARVPRKYERLIEKIGEMFGLTIAG